MKSRSSVSNGLLQGLSQGWHTNGLLQVEETYVAGISHGLRSKWHPDGRLQSEAPVVGGRVHGFFQRWDEQGALVEEIEMRDDQPEGISRAYHPDGSVRIEVRMKAGRVVTTQSWPVGEHRAATLSARDGRRGSHAVASGMGSPAGPGNIEHP